MLGGPALLFILWQLVVAAEKAGNFNYDWPM
jgi:hypothetical protein